jgi:hypothetical protein
VSRVLNGLPNAVSPQRPQIVYATVSKNQPAPRSFTDPLYVVEPHDPNGFKVIVDWIARSLPQAGDDVTLITDFQRTIRAVVWNATTAPTVSGSRSGGTALASLLTQLSDLGLIVNSTTS